MEKLGEVVDTPIADFRLTLGQYGLLAANEFYFYFKDLPEFEPKMPGDRPVIDMHVGTWVEEAGHSDGHLLSWQTRPQQKDAEAFETNCRLIKVNRDPLTAGIIGTPHDFYLLSNEPIEHAGDRLARKFDTESLQVLTQIVRKEKRFRKRTEVPLDKFVIGAVINDLDTVSPISRSPRNRRKNRRT